MNKLLFSLLIILSLNSQSFAQESSPVTPAFKEFQAFINLRDLSISQDGSEVYFTNQSVNGKISVICTMNKSESGKWNSPEIVSFSGLYSDMEPFLSPDNLSL